MSAPHGLWCFHGCPFLRIKWSMVCVGLLFYTWPPAWAKCLTSHHAVWTHEDISESMRTWFKGRWLGTGFCGWCLLATWQSFWDGTISAWIWRRNWAFICLSHHLRTRGGVEDMGGLGEKEQRERWMAGGRSVSIAAEKRNLDIGLQPQVWITGASGVKGSFWCKVSLRP